MTKRKSSSREGKAFSKKFKRAGVIGYGQKTATAAVIAKRVLDDRMEVKEKIHYVVDNPTTTGTVLILNDIAQGNGIGNRSGNRISMKQFQVDYEISQTSSGSGLVALVYDKQPNGAVAAFSDIFDTVAGQPAGIAFKNTYENTDRFVIQWIDMYPQEWSAVEAGTAGRLITRKRHFYKCAEQEIDVRYNNNSADPNTGAWYLVYGDTANNTTNTTITVNIKSQFTDV